MNNCAVTATDTGSIPGQVKKTYFHQSRRGSNVFIVGRGPSPWLKRPDRETGLSPLSGIDVNSLNAKLNPICHLLALLANHILHVSRIRVKRMFSYASSPIYAFMTWCSPNRTVMPCLRLQTLLLSAQIITPFSPSKHRVTA